MYNANSADSRNFTQKNSCILNINLFAVTVLIMGSYNRIYNGKVFYNEYACPIN